MHNYDLNVILEPGLNETQLKLEKDAISRADRAGRGRSTRSRRVGQQTPRLSDS